MCSCGQRAEKQQVFERGNVGMWNMERFTWWELHKITTMFSVIVLKLIILWRETFFFTQLKVNKSTGVKKQQWSLRRCGRNKIATGVWALTHTPITLISPPFPPSPHPLQLNTKIRHGPQNCRKLVPWRLPWPRYWGKQWKTHTNTHSITGPEQTTRFILCSKSCCQIFLRFAPITRHLISSSVIGSVSLMSSPATECPECC